MHTYTTLFKLSSLCKLLASVGKLPKDFTLSESLIPDSNCVEYRLNTINCSILLGYSESGCTQNIWASAEYFENNKNLDNPSEFISEDKQLIELNLIAEDSDEKISIKTSVDSINDIVDHAAAVVDAFYKLSNTEQRAMEPSLVDAIAELEELLEVYLKYQRPE